MGGGCGVQGVALSRACVLGGSAHGWVVDGWSGRLVGVVSTSAAGVPSSGGMVVVGGKAGLLGGWVVWHAVGS